jgi:serine/threonine protein kinase
MEVNLMQSTSSQNRIPLEPFAVITLDGKSFEIEKLHAYGGSCIAYKAKEISSDAKQSFPVRKRPVIIKEFYPDKLSACINRVGKELIIPSERITEFEKRKEHFVNGVKEQVAYYAGASNHTLNFVLCDRAYGTAYSVVELANGDILVDCCVKLSLNKRMRILLSLCNALKKLHRDDKLYLDIKPANIFVFEEEFCESPRIALFDFDTVINIDDKESVELYYSAEWAPFEVKREGHRDEISPASDIYTIGALLYWLISGEVVTDDILNCIEDNNFSFLDKCKLLDNVKSDRRHFKNVLRQTLMRNSKERTQNMEVLIGEQSESEYNS